MDYILDMTIRELDAAVRAGVVTKAEIMEVTDESVMETWWWLWNKITEPGMSYADFLKLNPNYGRMIEPIDGTLKRLLPNGGE